MTTRVVLASALALGAMVSAAVSQGSTPQAVAQAATGPAAYYAPNWDPTTIYYRHHAWGNTVPGAVHPPHTGHYCVHPDYRPGQVLRISANGLTTTCLIFDMVQTQHQAQWRARWSLEVDWSTFHALRLHLNNRVTVHGLAGGDAVSTSVQTSSEQRAQRQYRYFAETGYIVGNAFLHYWEDYGGLGVFGYPLSDEYDDDGVTIQVFERAVFEYHPDNAPEFRVMQRRLGAQYYDDPDLDHDIHPLFKGYWSSNGGLLVFGYPISGLIEADGLQYQVFERAVMEYHPNGDILLRRLGAKLYA